MQDETGWIGLARAHTSTTRVLEDSGVDRDNVCHRHKSCQSGTDLCGEACPFDRILVAAAFETEEVSEGGMRDIAVDLVRDTAEVIHHKFRHEER